MEPTAKDRIRAAALELFAEKGYAATATREICQQAGVTKPTLYYHFQSKQQLYRTLVREAYGESIQRLREASQRGKTSEKKLVNFLAADFELTRGDPKLATMLFRDAFATERGIEETECVELAMEWMDLLAEVVQEGIERGELKGHPHDIAEAFIGIHMVYTMGYLLTGEPALDRKLARRIVKLMLNGCGRNSNKR